MVSQRKFSASHDALVQRAMTVGRENGARAILFHQAIAHALGLNASDTRCLDLILVHGPSSPKDLAALTGLTTGAVTVLIDRLERAGFVKRCPAEDDRRKTLLVATPKVPQALGPLYAPMAANMQKFLSAYPSQDLAVLVDFMSRMAEFWRNETARVLSARGSAKTSPKRRRQSLAIKEKNK